MKRPEVRISAGEFKATCLKLIDEVQKQRKEIVITKRGKPAARLVPLSGQLPEIFGRMKGTGKMLGDIVS